MKICCLGDSLTEGDYGIFGKRCIPNVQPENYPYFLGQISGADTANFGRSGATAVSYLEYYNTGAVPVRDGDIIIILLGTNGGLDDRQDTPGNRAYEELVSRCRLDGGKAQIVLCTPPHATKNPAMSNYGYAPAVEKAVGFVRQFAKKQQLPLIDLAQCPAFTDRTESVMQPNDGLHFTQAGYRTMAEYIFAGLRQLRLID